MDKNIEIFCQRLSKETGITFPPSRYVFILNRLSPLFEKYQCHDLAELMSYSKNDLKVKMDITNVLTTNETWFFRHPEQFEILKNNIFPELIQRKTDKSISIWSAGCSIGAELYSILITALESIPESANFRINILGSDISYDAIKIAQKGIYDTRDLRTTDRSLIQKYFNKLNENTFEIKEELKSYVTFEYLNLIQNWPPRTFDIIFCRNTMIYFNEQNKKLLQEKLFKTLEINGYFFTSANEQIDINEKEYGINKVYLNNEVVYQKQNKIHGYCEIFFKTPSDLLRATNYLRKNLFDFQFGKPLKAENGNTIRSIIIKNTDSDNILSNLSYNSIPIMKTVCLKS